MFHAQLRNLGLCPPRGSSLFYLLIIFVLIIYCIYINQNSTSPFQFKFNEPLEVKFIGQKLMDKLKKQDNERANSIAKLTDMESMKEQNSDVSSCYPKIILKWNSVATD